MHFSRNSWKLIYIYKPSHFVKYLNDNSHIYEDSLTIMQRNEVEKKMVSLTFMLCVGKNNASNIIIENHLIYIQKNLILLLFLIKKI